MSFSLAYSQMNGDSRYSFGVKGYNYMQMPKMLNQSDDHTYLSSYFNSYMVKFNDNLFSYRLSGSYLDKTTEFFNNCDNCDFTKGKVKDYSFKMGFEKNFSYGAIQPYFAFDLGYRSDEFSGTLTNANSENYIVSSRNRGFTITPALGLKLNPFREISIFAEGNLEFFYAWGKDTSRDALNNSTEQRFKKGEFLFNPVSVGIQFHIGRSRI